MDEETHHYDLRSRSRSRSHTPMVFNQNLIDFNINDHSYLRDQGNKKRSQTPVEVSSSRRSESRSLPKSTLKSDKITEETLKNVEDIKNPEVTVEYENQNEKFALSTTKKVEKRSERRRIRRQVFVNGQGELKESKSIKMLRKSSSPNRIITSDYSSEGGEFDDSSRSPRSAYEIYKQAGDWWDVFPKTDYTYSPASQCRYEIAPGILAMPNMSRTSIHLKCGSNCNSLTYSQLSSTLMSQSISKSSSNYLNKDIIDTSNQNRLNEEYSHSFSHYTAGNSDLHFYNQTQTDKSRNFETSCHRKSENIFNSFSQINSNTESGGVISLNTNNNKKWMISWFEKIKNVLTLLFINLFQFIGIKMLKTDHTASHSYWQYQESTWTKVWKRMYQVFQYLYLLLIRALFFDSWILRCASTFSKRLRMPRSKWIMFILPLLLFLVGYWFYPFGKNFDFSLFSTTAFSQFFFTTKKSFTPRSPIEPTEKHDFNINNAVNEKISQQIINLIDRVEKLEAIQNYSEENILKISQSHAKLKVDEEKVWELYEKKISDLEDKIINKQHILEHQNNEKKNTYDEIKNIKTELNSLQNLYANLKICCDKSISIKEINEIVTNLIISSNNNKKSDNEDSMTMKCENLPDTSSLSEENIKNIVKEILKTYNADKTGKVDYALESAGGQIISIRCTQSYNVNTRAFKVLGFTLYYESSDPRTVIQGHSLQPGVCWAFQDFPGYLLIKLRSPIKVIGFTVEHAPKSILPNNEIKSAPKKFNVWGLKEENDSDPVLFGEYEFLDNDESLQYFPVQNLNLNVETYEFIELKIHSNHGQLEYTCLYRFRVHGTLI